MSATAIELAANEYGFRTLAAIPILILGLYVFKSNPKELSNRVFAAFCLLWTVWIVAVNLVSLAIDQQTADTWNRISAYSLVLLVPTLIHFVLVFPYRSRLIKRVWVVPTLYAASLALLFFVIQMEPLFLRDSPYDFGAGAFSPNFRPSLYFLQSMGFTIATLFLVIRYAFTDLEVTRKRLYFVLFAIATYSFYEAIGDVHINRDPEFVGGFEANDLDFWRLTLVSDALAILTYFALLVLLWRRTRSDDRRHECLVLVASGLGALVTGYFDPILRGVFLAYPGVLWLWRIAAVALMFYAILKYQLFDLNVRIRIGIKYGTLTTVFGAVLFTVQEIVKDVGGAALGYFFGLIAAAGMLFLFTPIQHLIERFSKKVVPATSTESYEKYRSMEIYRAALEGALADRTVSLEESHALRNLREKLNISDMDHKLLERDIRSTMEKAPV